MTAEQNPNLPAKTTACDFATSSPPGGGRTFSNSENPQQSSASAASPCALATERCANEAQSGGENPGNLSAICPPTTPREKFKEILATAVDAALCAGVPGSEIDHDLTEEREVLRHDLKTQKETP